MVPGKEQKLEMVRHSAAHVMAEAVQTIFPGAKFAIGPAIENGFYYDFDVPRSLTPDDLPLIEARMSEIIALCSKCSSTLLHLPVQYIWMTPW